jgi:hypothetical protein
MAVRIPVPEMRASDTDSSGSPSMDLNRNVVGHRLNVPMADQWYNQLGGPGETAVAPMSSPASGPVRERDRYSNARGME